MKRGPSLSFALIKFHAAIAFASIQQFQQAFPFPAPCPISCGMIDGESDQSDLCAELWSKDP